MLDPQYLAHITDEIEAMFAELEISILSDIARRIKENKYENTSTAQHQLNRLSAMGMQYDEMQKQISNKLGISEKKVASIIDEASYGSVGQDNVIFKEAFDKGLIHRFNYDKDGMRELILAGVKATNGEIKNICKTTAQTARDLFVSKLDQVYLSVSSGAFSVDDAVKTACTEIGKKGIQWIDCKSGTHRRVDSSIRTAIRTGVNQTACKCQDKNFEDMGGNLVEVTSHMGARPEHAIWQGKIYWRKKQYRNYQKFEAVTGYGTGAGLGGWNCRHSFFPFFEGLSSKSFDHYRIGENNERYELDQQQRYNERMIREWKRRSAVNYAGGIDNSFEARKVREWMKQQSEFLETYPELKRNYAREGIYSIDLKKAMEKKNKILTKGYWKAIDKGDISSFVTLEIYLQEAVKLDEELLGLKIKGGIIVTGYKPHFLDRKIGQYESSNEPIKGMRKGVSLTDIIDCLLSITPNKISEKEWHYISNNCKITLNPNTKMLIQVNPYKRKKGKNA